MELEEVLQAYASLENPKTKEYDRLNKQWIRQKADVSSLAGSLDKHPALHRTFFQVSLAGLANAHEQLDFIEAHADLLQDWWHVDQLCQFMKKPLDFDYAFDKASAYVKDDRLFLRRWGYVLFLCGLQKDSRYTQAILSLLQADDAYYSQMAQAWLLCDLAVFHPDAVYDFLAATTLPYEITGKAISKIQDSYRISQADKARFASLRQRWKG